MNQALQQSRAELAHYDLNRDLFERRDKIHHLTRIGMSAQEIADVVGLVDRSVVRHRQKPAAPSPPRLYNAASASEDRVRELDRTADFALQLAAILHDEDVTIVWGSLARLTRRQLQELAVVALAAIPIDRTKDELLQWVRDLDKGEA